MLRKMAGEKLDRDCVDCYNLQPQRGGGDSRGISKKISSDNQFK